MPRLLAFLLALAVALPARAADTLIHYSKTYMDAAMVADLEDALTGMGATVTSTTSTSWRTDYSGYKLVIILLPEADFSTTQASALTSFVNGGGRLVISGDWEEKRGPIQNGFYENNDYVNSLMTKMSTGLSVGTSVEAGTGYTNATATIATAQHTEGMTDYWIAASNTVSGGTDLLDYKGKDILQYGWPSSSTASCVPNDVVISGDVNLFIGDGCTGCVDTGSNWTLWENLYYWTACDADADGYYETGVCCGDDCNDADGNVNPGESDGDCDGVDDDCDGTPDDDGATTRWYRDGDGDGYGDPSTSTLACTAPSGYVASNTDCDDANAAIKPGATETCNGIDDDCDTLVDEGIATSTYYRDADGDTYGTTTDTKTACSAPTGYVSRSGDCNDANGAVNPGATEVCNSVDDDCDGSTDEGVTTTYYVDADGDSYGTSVTTQACSRPSGYATRSGDCNDSSAAINPGATETCNGIDDDCDGSTDEGIATSTYYRDADGDTYGTSTDTKTACSAPSGYVSRSGDCNDANADVNPGETEVCNSIDDDCDGSTDEGVKTTYYADADGDAYGTSASTQACTKPSGYASVSGDCDDTDANVNPGETEVCNGVDDDCDGGTDEGLTSSTWYRDADGDSYGVSSDTVDSCSPVDGYVTRSGDCDDADDAVNPGATEVCNTIDDDCDGSTDEGVTDTYYADADLDGYGDASVTKDGCTAPTGYVADATDCDDTDDNVNPGRAEIPYDGIDQDCSGADLCDADADGYAFDGGACAGDDCDDSDPDIGPGVVEAADGVDEDCDGVVDEGTEYYDDDGDGFTESGGDCDDADDTIAPSALEDCDTVDQDCDGVVDEGTDCYDDDADGFTEDDGDCNDSDDAVNPDEAEVDGNGVDDDCDGATDTGVDDSDLDGYAGTSTDCDDEDATVYPGAPEVADGLDNDCDGVVDEGTEAYDDDGDGTTELDGDCNDADADVSPDGSETLDGRDEDCDDLVDEGTDRFDDDGDGYTEEAGDCDDANADVNPGVEEVENGVDDDCDGTVDGSGDQDGDGYTVADGDCDDREGWTNPGQAEFCDGLDNNCDGDVDEGCAESGISEVPDRKCGCATGAGVPWWLGGLVLIALRRSKRATEITE